MGFGSGYRVQREDDTFLPVVAAPLSFVVLVLPTLRTLRHMCIARKVCSEAVQCESLGCWRILSSSVYASLTLGRVCKANSSNHAAREYVQGQSKY